MVHVRRDYPRFQAAGGEVAVITMGSPAQVAAFRQRLELPFPCYSDKQRVAYRALAVPEGTLAQVAGPATWRAGLAALVRRGLGFPQAHPFQLHAAFVVDPQNVIRFVHRPRHSADHPSHDAMIAALSQVASHG